ncbi:MAG: hypothetical protein ACTHNW_20365 [Mucilaginibacter sp.]
MATTLAYQISRNLNNLHCDLHHMGISTGTSKETTIVKVCCEYFRSDVEKELEKRYGKELVKTHIRFRLPVGEISTSSAMTFSEDQGGF